MAFGSGAMTNSIAEIKDTKFILVIGSNTTEAHPVLALEIKKAVRAGSKLVVVDPRKIELARMALNAQEATVNIMVILVGGYPDHFTTLYVEVKGTTHPTIRTGGFHFGNFPGTSRPQHLFGLQCPHRTDG